MNTLITPDNSLQGQIGKYLVTTGVITPQQLDVCLRQQKSSRDSGQPALLAEVIARNKFASQEQIGFAVKRLDSERDSILFRRLLPLSLCKQYSVFPIDVEGGILILKAARVMTAATKAILISACEVSVTALRVMPTDIGDILRSLAGIYREEHTFESIALRLRNEEINGLLLKQALNALLGEAIVLRASDIHLDKLRDPNAWISYRIDGVLKPTHLVPERIMAALFSRIKNESGMDASDTRRAQDGRLSLINAGAGVEFRVATQPIAGGETIAIRVLDPASMIGLDALFPFQLQMHELFRQLANVRGKTGGLVLISGPTGSGKTTTLYALAQNFSRDRINVITVEEPVEYILPFARQIQLNQLLNEKSADLERSVLRQDPDVLILGEIRDNDTMRAALKFAESGHLVLATVHAKNVAQTFERVLSFCDVATKQEALYVLANQLSVVVNQGLIPKLCACASEVDTESAAELHTAHAMTFHGHAQFLRRRGCPACNQTGYRGRVAIHETVIIPTSTQLRDGITRLLFESIHHFQAVLKMDGVTHIDKHAVMARLLECHVVDAETVTQAIRAGF
ncbi:GspE/PulE family protein [Actimicrobium antarcticum]|uniref:Type IV-A pilus assembly ATPase PilB n=1 Tax=Actimicrobium antarcticum TaxID=1051899 RepID=A0ABP7TSW2_9BURK